MESAMARREREVKVGTEARDTDPGHRGDYFGHGMVWFDHGVSPRRTPADQGSSIIRQEPRSEPKSD